MCYIMLVKKTNQPAVPELEASIKAIIKQRMDNNDDGFLIALPNNNYRTLDQTAANARLDEISINNLMTHARAATSGSRDLTNVHGWERDGFVFAHNGQIYDYAQHNGQVTNTGETDSKILFDKLINQMQGNLSDKRIAKIIRRQLKNISFWGRAFLYHKPTDRMFLFGDWHLYLIAETYLLFSSSALTFIDQTKPLAVAGVNFNVKTDTGILEQTFDGIAVISDFSTDNFHFKPLGKLTEAVKVTTYKNYNSYIEPNNAHTLEHIRDQSQLPLINREYLANFLMLDSSNHRVQCYYGTDDRVHDILNECCYDGTCDMFYDIDNPMADPMTEPKNITSNNLMQVY